MVDSKVLEQSPLWQAGFSAGYNHCKAFHEVDAAADEIERLAAIIECLRAEIRDLKK